MDKIKKVIIFGIGQIAELVQDLIEENKTLELQAFCADKEFVIKNKFNGYDLVSLDQVVEKFPPREFYFITALSYSNLNQNRESIYKKLKNLGYDFINLISEKSIFKADTIGENNIIFELNNIQKGVKIGNNSFEKEYINFITLKQCLYCGNIFNLSIVIREKSKIKT